MIKETANNIIEVVLKSTYEATGEFNKMIEEANSKGSIEALQEFAPTLEIHRLHHSMCMEVLEVVAKHSGLSMAGIEGVLA